MNVKVFFYVWVHSNKSHKQLKQSYETTAPTKPKATKLHDYIICNLLFFLSCVAVYFMSVGVNVIWVLGMTWLNFNGQAIGSLLEWYSFGAARKQASRGCNCSRILSLMSLLAFNGSYYNGYMCGLPCCFVLFELFDGFRGDMWMNATWIITQWNAQLNYSWTTHWMTEEQHQT